MSLNLGSSHVSLWLHWSCEFWARIKLKLWWALLLSSVQSLSRVRLFGTPWIAACQASLSITNSQSPPRPMSFVSVMPSNHLILYHPLLLLPPIPPSIRVFSNESVLRIRWPKYWSFSFNISSSSEHPGLISFRMELSSCIPSTKNWWQPVPSLVMLTLITWIRWYLPAFSTVKLLCFPLKLINVFWWDILKLCKYLFIPFSPTNFNIYWFSWPEIINTIIAKLKFSTSFIPSILINWNSTVRKTFLLYPIYLPSF